MSIYFKPYGGEPGDDVGQSAKYSFIVVDQITGMVIVDASDKHGQSRKGRVQIHQFVVDELPDVYVTGHMLECEYEKYCTQICQAIARTPAFLKTRYTCTLRKTDGDDLIPLITDRTNQTVVLDGSIVTTDAKHYGVCCGDFRVFTWMTVDESVKWSALISHTFEQHMLTNAEH